MPNHLIIVVGLPWGFHHTGQIPASSGFNTAIPIDWKAKAVSTTVAAKRIVVGPPEQQSIRRQRALPLRSPECANVLEATIVMSRAGRRRPSKSELKFAKIMEIDIPVFVEIENLAALKEVSTVRPGTARKKLTVVV